ncbi:MAG: hypothetical protein ABIF10_04885 [Candidatus Woesearchaeota archaeon]
MSKYFDISKPVSTLIGIFGLIVVTTASFQAFIWEYKYYHSESQLHGLRYMVLVAEKSEKVIEGLKEFLKKK